MPDLVAKLERILAPEAVLRIQINNILSFLAPLVENDRPLFRTTYPDGIIRWFSSQRKEDLSYTGEYGMNIFGVSLPPVFRQDLNIWCFALFVKFRYRNIRF